jgi:adenylate cyclase
MLESIGDPTLTLAMLYAALPAKFESGEVAETLRLAQLMIDLAGGDPAKGNLVFGSPLVGAITFRGCARCCLGDPRWRDDIDTAATMVREFDATTRAIVLLFTYGMTTQYGLLAQGAIARQETAELLRDAERSGDDFTLACARCVRAMTLVDDDDSQRKERFALLAAVREAALQERFTLIWAWTIDVRFAEEKARTGDLDGAIEISRGAVESIFGSGDKMSVASCAAVLVAVLLRRGSDADLQEAQAVIDRLAAVPNEPGFVTNDLWLLRMRAGVARARGDEIAYHDYMDRYRAMANSLGFEGHIAWASEME